MENSDFSMDTFTDEESYGNPEQLSSESDDEQANRVEISAGGSSESESDGSELGYAEPQLFSWEASESGDDEDDLTEFSGHTDSDNFTDYEQEEQSEEDNEERNTESGKRRRIITSSSRLNAFPSFLKLPLELRLRIWELHCPALFESSRVIEVVLQRSERLIPGPTLIRQSRPLRRFMQISRETRARGLRTVPDELAIGSSNLDNSVLRFHAQADILHFSYEEHNAVLAQNLYGNVHNIALHDLEVRSRRPGVYHDHVNDHSVISFMSTPEVSHQTPSELRSLEFCKALDKAFPRLENVYVLERGSLRQVDCWVGADNHEEFVINTYERDEYGRRYPLRAIYCWHAPPKRCRIGHARHQRVGREGENQEENVIDFEDGAVINHIHTLKEKGVRFSRMLFYEGEEGWETLLQMQAMCVDGKWPVNADGRPRDDDPEPYGAGWFEPISEYESDGIDDEEIEEDSSDDEDDDLVVDDETRIPGANLSSASPEVNIKSDNTRSKKRRVVSDSDDSDGEAINEIESAAADMRQGPRAKRRHLIAISDEDDDDKEMARPLKRKSETRMGERRDERDEDEDEGQSSNTEDEQGSKRLTLVQRLSQAGNLTSSESDSDSDSDSDSEGGYD